MKILTLALKVHKVICVCTSVYFFFLYFKVLVPNYLILHDIPTHNNLLFTPLHYKKNIWKLFSVMK